MSLHTSQVDLKNSRVRRNFRVTRRGRMTASNASQITIRKIATPAMKAPGAGTMGGIVLVRPGWAKTGGASGFEAGADGNLRFEKLRDRAAGFRGLDRGVKFGFV